MKELNADFFEEIYPLKLSENEIVLKVVENDKDYFKLYKDYINNNKYIFGIKSAIRMKEYDMLKFLLDIKDFDIHRGYGSPENIVLYVMKYGNLKSLKTVFLHDKFDISKCEFCIYEVVSLFNSVEALDFIINNTDKHCFLYQHKKFFYLLNTFVLERKYQKIKVILNNRTYQLKADYNYLMLLIRLVERYSDKKAYRKLITYVLNRINIKEIEKLKNKELLLRELLYALIEENDKKLFHKIYFSSVLSNLLQKACLNNNFELSIVKNPNLYLFKCLKEKPILNEESIYKLLSDREYEFINYCISINKINFSINNLILIINSHPDYCDYLFKNSLNIFNVINDKIIEKKVSKDKKEKVKMKLKLLNF